MPTMKRPAMWRGESLSNSLSIAALANRWHLPAHDIRRMLAQQVLPFWQIDGQIRIPLVAVRRHERHQQQQ